MELEVRKGSIRVSKKYLLLEPDARTRMATTENVRSDEGLDSVKVDYHDLWTIRM